MCNLKNKIPRIHKTLGDLDSRSFLDVKSEAQFIKNNELYFVKTRNLCVKNREDNNWDCRLKKPLFHDSFGHDLKVGVLYILYF